MQPLDLSHITFIEDMCDRSRRYSVPLYDRIWPKSRVKPLSSPNHDDDFSGSVITPSFLKARILTCPRNRIYVRGILSSMNAIAVSHQRSVVPIETIEAVEGRYVSMTLVRWMHFIRERRRRRGFQGAFKPYLDLVQQIALGRATDDESEHIWSILATWTQNPDDDGLTADLDSAAQQAARLNEPDRLRGDNPTYSNAKAALDTVSGYLTRSKTKEQALRYLDSMRELVERCATSLSNDQAKGVAEAQ